jgi:hypothetical protein
MGHDRHRLMKSHIKQRKHHGQNGHSYQNFEKGKTFCSHSKRDHVCLFYFWIISKLVEGQREDGGGVLLFLRSFLITPPLRFADGQQGVYGKRISRRCLRRNLPFLPGPCQAFRKNLIN